MQDLFPESLATGSAVMMTKLSIASWGLFIGAIGQAGFYRLLFPRLPSWVMVAPLFLPWLIVFIISFCNLPPFGPRLFRHSLMFAMCWYGVFTLLAEVLYLIIHPAAHGHFTIISARVLTYIGALSFVVFVRACVFFRNYETIHDA